MSLRAFRRMCMLLVLAASVILVPASAQGPSDGAVEPEQTGFDPDAFSDLAIGVPGETLAGIVGAGAVNTLYGDVGGLSADRGQLWSQNEAGVPDPPEFDDEFGLALAAGDFDGNGSGDLAVGVPLEDVLGQADAGAVNILYGSGAGLSATGSQFWHQGSDGTAGLAEAGDEFGRALTTGDFDGDGYDDLAVGVPWQDVGGAANAGAVHVFYGSAGGLTALRDEVWDQGNPGLVGTAEVDDEFGRALAGGDFDADGYDDLAIGVRGADIGPLENAGRVIVLYGSPGGLSVEGNQLWDQNNPEVAGGPLADDLFGDALAAGHLNGDAYEDLAIGIPKKDLAGLGGAPDAGAVLVLYGSGTGLATAGNELWSQDSDNIADVAEAGDFFGQALVAADLNGDLWDDLAIGVPFEDVLIGETTMVDAGAVNVLYGSNAGLTDAGNQFWYQGLQEVLGASEEGDAFGFALASGDFDADGFGDLAVGVPSETPDSAQNAGAVNVLYGSAAGLSTAGNQLWRQDTPGVEGEPNTDDLFGFALATVPRGRFTVFLPLILRGF
jgi:hypothetical protein